MSLWTPVFGKIVDSSLWTESDVVVKVFITMIAKKNANHVVEASAFMISQWAKKTEKEVLDALKVLASPDKKRLEKQPFDGRRIERVDDGWLILNGQYYEDLMRKTNRRTYQANWQKNYRQKKKDKPLPGEEKYVATYGAKGRAAADAQLDKSQAGCDPLQYPGGDE